MPGCMGLQGRLCGIAAWVHRVAAANVLRSRLGLVRIFASFIVSKVATEKASLCSILSATCEVR